MAQTIVLSSRLPSWGTGRRGSEHTGSGLLTAWLKSVSERVGTIVLDSADYAGVKVRFSWFCGLVGRVR